MKKLIFGTLVLFFACQSAQAYTVFSCLTKTAKQILFEKVGDYYIYSYGKYNERPEIFLKNRVADVVTHSESGSEAWYPYPKTNTRESLVLVNGNYAYRIFSFSKHYGEAPGVEVSKNGEVLATVYCKKMLIDSLMDEVPQAYY